MASNRDKDLNLAIIGEDLTRKATDSAGNNFDRLQRKVDNFSASGKTSGDKFSKGFGEGMYANIPFIGGFVDKVSAKIGGFIDKIAPQVIEDATNLGTQAGTQLGLSASSALGAAGQDIPQLFTPEGAIGAAILVVIGGVLSAAIGAGIAAAVVAGVGFGFIAAGAAIVHNNPKIVSAFANLKSDVVRIFKIAAEPLVKPFLAAIDIIDKTILSRPDLFGFFAQLAPAIEPLAAAFTQIALSITPGLVKDSAEFAKIFSDPKFLAGVETLGPDLNAFFETIGRHQRLVEDFFKGVVATIALLIGFLNILVNTASFVGKVFADAIHGIIWVWGQLKEAVGNVISTITFWVRQWKPNIDKAADGMFDSISHSFDRAVSKIESIYDTLPSWLRNLIGGNSGSFNIIGSESAGGPSGHFSAGMGGFTPAFAGGAARVTEPARPISVSNNVNATLLLNGRVLASATQREINKNNRKMKIRKR